MATMSIPIIPPYPLERALFFYCMAMSHTTNHSNDVERSCNMHMK